MNDSDHLTRHCVQLSLDTRAAIQDFIEPYQPKEDKADDDDDGVVVIDYPSHTIHQSAMV